MIDLQRITHFNGAPRPGVLNASVSGSQGMVMWNDVVQDGLCIALRGISDTLVMLNCADETIDFTARFHSVVDGDVTVFAHVFGDEVVAVAIPTGHAVSKSIRRIIREAAGVKRTHKATRKTSATMVECDATNVSMGAKCTAPARYVNQGRNACGRHRSVSTTFVDLRPEAKESGQ